MIPTIPRSVIQARLAGWLAAWPAGWLAGWLAGLLAGWLAGWLAGLRNNRATRSAEKHQIIGWPKVDFCCYLQQNIGVLGPNYGGKFGVTRLKNIQNKIQDLSKIHK